MILQTLVVGPLEVNCYLIGAESGGDIAIVDPGGDAAIILEAVKKIGRPVSMIINTHCHFDHVGAVSELLRVLKTDYVIHSRERDVLSAMNIQMEMFGFRPVQPPVPTRFLDDDQVFSLGDLSIKVLHTPGHSPGGICLYDSENRELISGDTLFRDSIGRTDLPGGSSKTLINSIKDKLMTLPESVKVYPGHGPSTTIGHELKCNLFLQDRAR